MKINSSVIIHRPLQVVWDTFDNPDKLHLWLQDFKRFEHQSGTPGEAGAISLQIYENKGKEFILEEELIEKDAPNYMTGILRHDMMESAIETRFDIIDDEHTRLQCSSDIQFKGIGWRLLGPLMKRHFHQRQQQDLERFKALCEQT